MTQSKSFLGTTRTRDAHESVFPGDPLAVIGVFVALLRSRFAGDNIGRSAYYWAEDPTPEPDETGEPDKPRKIIIESQYLQNPIARDMTPGLFVERGDLAFQSVAIGNRGDHDRRTGQDFYYIQGVMPISVLCVSKTRGESMQLGSLVGFFLTASMTGLREEFGFQDVRPPIVGGTQVYRRSQNDIETWVTPVNLQVTCKYLWIETPIAPKLREIRARLVASTETGGTSISVEQQLIK